MNARVAIFVALGVAVFACANSDDAKRSDLLDSGADTYVPPEEEDVGVKDANRVDARKPDASKPDAGHEGDPCTVGLSQTEACGKCGTHDRTCNVGVDGGGGWSAWSTCTGESTDPLACDPSNTPTSQACGNCGTQTIICDPSNCSLILDVCKEPVFTGVPACTPTTKNFNFGACPGAREGRYQTCDTTCKFGAFGACEALAPPVQKAMAYSWGNSFECLVGPDGLTGAGAGVRCWGADVNGELGDGVGDSTSSAAVPKVVSVSGITTAVAIASGYTHTCALLADGTVKCWGGNSLHEINTSSSTAVFAPATVAGLSGVKRISASTTYSCALLTSGSIQCWGQGPSGATIFAAGGAPSAVPNAIGMKDVVASLTDICGIDASGGVKCWNDAHPTTPIAISGITNAEEVRMGNGFGCARIDDGTLKCWGVNGNGQLGNGGNTASPTAAVSVAGMTNAIGITMSANSACALTATEDVKCWGYLANTGGNVPVLHPGYPQDSLWVAMSSQKIVTASAGNGFFTAGFATTSVPTKFPVF